MDPDAVHWIVDGVIYGLALIISLFIFWKTRHPPQPRKVKLIKVSIVVGFALRVVWMIGHAIMNPQPEGDESKLSFILNRIAIAVHFLPFIVVFLDWLTSLQSQFKRTIEHCIATLVGLFLFAELVNIILVLAKVVDVNGTSWYDFIDFTVILAFNFALILVLLCSDSYTLNNDHSESWRLYSRLRPAVIICVLCFFLRIIFWIYGSLVYDFQVISSSGAANQIDIIIYPTCWYTIPEILPAFAVLSLLLPTGPSTQTGAKINEGEDRNESSGFELPLSNTWGSKDNFSHTSDLTAPLIQSAQPGD